MEQKELTVTLYSALEAAEGFIDQIKEEIAKKQYDFVKVDVDKFDQAHWIRIKDLAKKLAEFKVVSK